MTSCFLWLVEHHTENWIEWPHFTDFTEWLVEVHVHLDVPPILLGTISGLRIGSRLIKPTMSSSTNTKVGLCHCR